MNEQIPITRVSVKNFKRLESLELSLEDINLLVGPNNSGKSSFIQGLQFAISALQSVRITPDAKGKTPSWEDDEISRSLPSNRLIYTPVAEPTTLGRAGTFSQKAGIEVCFEGPSGEVCKVEVKLGRNKNLNIKASGEKLGLQLQSLDPLFSILAPGLAGIAGTEEFRSAGLLRKAAARGDSNNYLRNFVYLLKQRYQTRWETFRYRLASIFPGIELDVRFDPEYDEFIQCDVSFDGGSPISIDLAGTGVLQAVQILTYVGLYSPRLLMLDEPDSHLHPSNQRLLVRTLAKVAEEDGCKVLLTTHSRHVLDEADAQGAAVNWLSGGQLQSGDTTLVQNLMKLGALDIAEVTASQELQGIVLTEDRNGREFMRCLAISNGWEDGAFDIVTYDGSANLHAVRVLIGYIRDNYPQMPIVVYRDRDFDESVIDQFRTLSEEFDGVFVVIPPGADSESMLLSEQFLEEFGLRFGIDINGLLEYRRLAVAERREEGIRHLSNCIANQNLFGFNVRPGQINPTDLIAAATEKVEQDPLRWIKGKVLLKSFDHHLRGESYDSVRDRLEAPYKSLVIDGFPERCPV